MASVSLILIFLILIAFTGLDHKAIISIALIMLFLMIFTYVFKTDGPKTLKVVTILFTFFGLPLFLLIYLDIFGFLTGILKIILSFIFALIFGVISVFLIIELDYVDVKVE
jgi:hypothetical protein